MDAERTAQEPLRPGTRLDAYEIRDVLGTGGFGVTYEAIETGLERRVAIKEYFPGSLATREADGTTVAVRSRADSESYQWGLTRFLSEARTLARFKNPHIVHVNRYLEANGTAYLVMDYEQGHPLSEVLQKRRIGERTIRKLMVPVLTGLKAIHEQDFLHRDVKPGNIFIRRKGPPLLIDFGAARQALQARTAAEMTVILTPGYAPLEQYGESEEMQGPWTDIYAFGATLFHCLTGHAPRDAAWRVQAAAHGVADPVREGLSTETPICSREMVELLCWMMMPLARDRPQTCDEVALHLYEISRTAAAPTVGSDRPAGEAARSSYASLRHSARESEQRRAEVSSRAQHAGLPTRLGGEAEHYPADAGSNGAAALNPEFVERARDALTDHMGPIARVLVNKAVGKAASTEHFVEMLADDIDDAMERERFRAALR